MSTSLKRAQSYRPYKIEIYGLQDNYIGTLQSFDDYFIGRVREAEVTIQEDGTQSFSCQIPKFYLEPKNNTKIINPRWGDVINGVLAENTRILKVFVKVENKVNVYPFIIDQIVDKRDEHFAVYKEVTGSGLAFSELGKVGYKLELTEEIVQLELEKDPNIIMSLNYWLDKVFPNEKDANGKVIRWLTPWCYEVRMDWSHYSDGDLRASNKVYDDAYVSSWHLKNNTFVPTEVTPCREKSRPINCVNSNKYNITQALAEAFEIFCHYEYKCSNNGQFLGEYEDDEKNIWRGRKVIFHNRAIKGDNPLVLDYQKNLQTISRTCDSTEIYSKLYVTPIESSIMTNKYVTIADAVANPLMEDYILNFDYLYEQGAINDYQKEFVEEYEKSIHSLNKELKEIGKLIEEATIDLNLAKSEASLLEKKITSAQQEYTNYEKMRNKEVTNVPIQKNKTNSYSVMFVPNGEIAKAELRLEGIAAGTIVGYKNSKYEEKDRLFTAAELVQIKKVNNLERTDPNIYLLTNEYDYPAALYASIENPIFTSTNSVVYLALEYSPKNQYSDICSQLKSTINISTVRKEQLDKIVSEKELVLSNHEKNYDDKLSQKEALYQKLEMVLGPALREGYWTPDSSYENAEEKQESILTIQKEINPDTQLAQLYFDTKPFEEEETGYYSTALSKDNAILGSSILGKLILGKGADELENGLSKTYYNYLNVSSLLASSWKNANLEKLVVRLQNPNFIYTATNGNRLFSGNYYIVYNSTRYYFKLSAAVDRLELQTTLTSEGKYILTILVTYTDKTEETIVASTSNVGFDGATNQTNIFENINSYLGDYLLYPNAGFVYSFINTANETIPIIMFNNPDIDYEAYTKIAWSFSDTEAAGYFEEPLVIPETFAMCYPRIAILTDNVNYKSDLLKISVIREGVETELTKYEDYQILTRYGQPYFTLKITKKNSLQDILYSSYRIIYRVSHANDLLYLDAKKVAKDNSRPRFEYSIDMAQIPENIVDIKLGQITYINDFELGTKGATGYISQFTLNLDSPSQDKITIQNYKTKFEDLFKTITAQSEAMRQSKISYDLAANNFEAGVLMPETLQTAIDDTSLSLNFSNAKVAIDDTQGILLSNEKESSNGVVGQMAMLGGGIYLSNQINPTTQERIWSNAITPDGINASTIRTGQLDTSTIRIFAGDEMTFQWNSEGIFAYKNENGIIRADSYVKYSQHGLEYVNENNTLLSLNWEGLIMRNKNGDVTFSMDRENGNLTMSGVINAKGGTIGGLTITPDALGSGNGVTINKDFVKIAANYDNQVYLDQERIQLKTLVDNSSTLIQMDKNGILLEAAEELQNGEKQINQLSLTKNVITFGAEQKVTISANGLSGQQASFDSLTVGGNPVFGNYAKIVVSDESKKPEGRNILWFKTTPIGTIESAFGSWSTGGSRHYRIQTIESTWSGTHDGAEKIKLGKMTPLDTTEEVNYTLSFPVYYWSNESNSSFTTEITAKLKLNDEEIIFTPVKITVGNWDEVIFTTTATAKNIITKEHVAADSELLLICKGTKSHNNFTINSKGSITLTVVNPNAHSGSNVTEYNCEVIYIE